MSGQAHILSLGIDLNPAIKKQISDYDDFIYDLSSNIEKRGKKNFIKEIHADEIKKISRKLNIKWISDSADNEVDVMDRNHIGKEKLVKIGANRISWIDDIKKQIIKSKK